MTRQLICVTASAVLAIGSLPTLAGDLNPPAGPVAPTFKTLHEVEPSTPIGPLTTPGDASAVFVISQAGHYHLTESFTGQPAKHGIDIRSSDVTIDLKGFQVIGVAGSLDGIHGVSPQFSIVVRNGRIFFWGDDGIDLVVSIRCGIENVYSTNNIGDGVLLGDLGYVINSIIDNNGGGGLVSLADSLVTNSISGSNGGVGFQLGANSLIEASIAFSNSADGISVGAASTVVNCTSNSNTARGIFLSSGSAATSCSAGNNGTDNIHTRFGCTVTGCTSRISGGAGIHTESASHVRGCTVQFSQSGTGIEVAEACTVSDCLITNCAIGMTMGTRCQITRCNASTNSGNGFDVGTRCRITDCHSSQNVNGFNLLGAESTIWHNSAVGNSQRGFINTGVGGGNLIVNNAASANGGDYLFAAVDTAGPIINNANIATNLNPHGNYSY